MKLDERVEDHACGSQCELCEFLANPKRGTAELSANSWIIHGRFGWDKKNSFSPVKKTGMLMKKPPTAHTRLMDDFCRYLLLLKQREMTEDESEKQRKRQRERKRERPNDHR